jgi:hypothetical protein
MSGEVKGETAVAQFRSPVDVRADIAGSPPAKTKRPPLAVQRGAESPPPPEIDPPDKQGDYRE